MITCTACDHTFTSADDLASHRARIPEWQLDQHDGHTARCLTLHEWAMMILESLRQSVKHSEGIIIVELL